LYYTKPLRNNEPERCLPTPKVCALDKLASWAHDWAQVGWQIELSGFLLLWMPQLDRKGQSAIHQFANSSGSAWIHVAPSRLLAPTDAFPQHLLLPVHVWRHSVDHDHQRTFNEWAVLQASARFITLMGQPGGSTTWSRKGH